MEAKGKGEGKGAEGREGSHSGRRHTHSTTSISPSPRGHSDSRTQFFNLHLNPLLILHPSSPSPSSPPRHVPLPARHRRHLPQRPGAPFPHLSPLASSPTRTSHPIVNTDSNENTEKLTCTGCSRLRQGGWPGYRRVRSEQGRQRESRAVSAVGRPVVQAASVYFSTTPAADTAERKAYQY